MKKNNEELTKVNRSLINVLKVTEILGYKSTNRKRRSSKETRPHGWSQGQQVVHWMLAM